jgi:hypothetical protein
MSNKKKMRYSVEFVCDTSVWAFTCSKAPYTFSVGDFVDPRGWDAKNTSNVSLLVITAVQHQLSSEDNSKEIKHNVIVSLKEVADKIDAPSRKRSTEIEAC